MNKFLIVKILVTLTAYMCLNACGLPYCEKVPFSESDLTWIEPYAEGDTILFSNAELNAVDTMIITKINISNPENTSIFDLKDCNWLEGNNEFSAVANCWFDMLHNGKSYQGMYSFNKKCHKKPAYFSIYIFGYYPIEDISIEDTTKEFVQNLKCDETLVIDDSMLECVTEHIDCKIEHIEQPLTEVHWNREIGLTYYKIGDDSYRLKR